MDDLADDRVYAGREGARRLVVAAEPGLAVVAVSGGRVGEFGLAWRGAPADVSAPRAPADGDGPRLGVATDADVLLAVEPEVDALAASDFGPAVAVTVEGGRVVAAAPDGRLAAHSGEGWTTLAELSATVTALDGDLVGASDGVHRLVDGALRPAGLDRVNDVARAAGVPLAATAEGLYTLGNGWMEVWSGDFQLVAGAPDGRAHAATAETLFERAGDEWRPVDLPADGPVAAVAYGDRPYALTRDGELLVEDDDGWNVHPLGLTAVRAAALL